MASHQHRRIVVRALVAGVALSLAVAGCSSSSSGSSGGSGTTKGGSVGDIEGRNWVLSDASKLAWGGSNVVVTARFDAGAMSGNSGCNSYNASYTATGNQLKIDANVAATQMACPPVPTAVERAYLARLPRVAAFTVKGSTLTLTSSTGEALLTYGESSGIKAVTGAWEVTGYYTGTAVQGPEPGSMLTAEFKGTTISGDGGCNTFTGPFEVTASSIKIGPLASTTRACVPDSVSTQEQHYLAALQAATTYAVAGQRLDLLRADGGFAVTFVRSRPTP